jgi:GntR family transcriptional regulator
MLRLPLYQQIAEDLRARIVSGDLAPGDTVPSESELIAKYKVSRITARNAVAALRASGLVVTSHGRPTTVKATAPDSPAVQFDPVITRDGDEWITWETHGWADVEDPSRYRTTAAAHGPALKLAPAEPVFILERQLISAAGAQVLSRVIVPFATAAEIPALEADPFRTPGDLYAALTTAGHQLAWQDTTRAVMPTPDDIAALGIGDGVPLLIHTRITLTADGRMLALEETRLPADRAAITSGQHTHG